MNRWLNWSVFVSLTAAYCVGAFKFQAVDYLLAVDKSYLSFVLLSLLWLVCLYSSYACFQHRLNDRLHSIAEWITLNFTLVGFTSTLLGVMLALQGGIGDGVEFARAVGTACLPTLIGIWSLVIGKTVLGMRQDG